MIPPLTSTGAGDNGLYGGQLQPMAVFLTALAAVISFDVKQADASDFELCACVSKACLIWGLFVRMVALVYFVAFFSLHGQIRGLAGKNGLFPAAEMLQRARQDFPGRMWRWLHFPAGLLWISCSDSALRGTCVLGMLCAAGAAYGVSSLSPLLLVLCWIILVQLSTVCGASFGYPWDCLLSEIGVFVGVLLPPVAPLLPLSGPRPALADLSSVVSAISLGLATSSTAASNAATPDAAAAAATAVLPSRVLPSRVAMWSLRLLLVRVVLGMGKMKFSSGWNGSDNHLYLKHFMSWQPLPTPLSRWMQTSSRIMTDGLWIAMHYAMWVLEVPLPALFLSGSLAVRSVASVLTIMLQLGIQLTGNYGTFNVLTAALAIPLLAPDCREAYALSGAASAAAATAATTTAGSAPSPISVAYLAGPQLLCALLLNVVGLIHFPHNSYTTNVWPYFPTYELVATMRPAYLRRPVTLLLKLFRALGPWHVAHGYGVFTPRALRGCSHARRSLRIEVSRNGGETWRELATRLNPCGRTHQSLDFFAPHQPRLVHHLFYEGFEIDLQLTSQTNPYWSASTLLLPRLAQRILEGSADVLSLLRILPLERGAAAAKEEALEELAALIDSGATHVRVVRSWVRFATSEERQQTGEVWIDCEPPEGTLGAASVIDHFSVLACPSSSAPGGRTRPSTFLPVFHDLPRLEGAWKSMAREMVRARLLRQATSGAQPQRLAHGGGQASEVSEEDTDNCHGVIMQHSFFHVPRKASVR